MEKRVSCRAIVFDDNKLVAMYREKSGKVYYTFPGGGLEENEELEECIVRECKEEFGIDVEPVREVYTYEDEKTVQHFFVCDWVSGEFGTGEGEEFSADRNRGVYVPTMLVLSDIPNKPLMPPEAASQLVADLAQYGKSLNPELTIINA